MHSAPAGLPAVKNSTKARENDAGADLEDGVKANVRVLREQLRLGEAYEKGQYSKQMEVIRRDGDLEQKLAYVVRHAPVDGWRTDFAQPRQELHGRQRDVRGSG